MKDLFDVLHIATREDSYTSLLATLFEQKPRWAREFFQSSGHEDIMPPKPVGVHKWPRATVPSRDVIPDLLLTFGDPVSEVWLIEVKLEASEGQDQLAAQESEKVRESLSESLSLPRDSLWHYSYLTLEGETPATAQRFLPTTFEPLNRIFTKKSNLPDEAYPAYEALRKRFRDYYKARNKNPGADSTLGEYLADTGGLVSERSRFYWLGHHLARDLKLKSELGMTQSGGPVPLCKLRDSSWKGQRYIKASETPLKDCHDIHLELQLSAGNMSFYLHYETNPYTPNLKSLPGNVTERQYEEYRQRRREFAAFLARHRETLEELGWKLTSAESVNQLAKLKTPPNPETDVEDARDALRAAAKSMRSAINSALREQQR